MAKNRIRPTDASVEEHIAAIRDEARRDDCETLMNLMSEATGQPPTMWGSEIVGFGSYHYKYKGGREGDMWLTGFSSQKRNIRLYLVGGSAEQARLLSKLGRHKAGETCLYIRRLSDIDLEILQQLIIGSVAEVKRLYG